MRNGLKWEKPFQSDFKLPINFNKALVGNCCSSFQVSFWISFWTCFFDVVRSILSINRYTWSWAVGFWLSFHFKRNFGKPSEIYCINKIWVVSGQRNVAKLFCLISKMAYTVTIHSMEKSKRVTQSMARFFGISCCVESFCPPIGM